MPAQQRAGSTCPREHTCEHAFRHWVLAGPHAPTMFQMTKQAPVRRSRTRFSATRWSSEPSCVKAHAYARRLSRPLARASTSLSSSANSTASTSQRCAAAMAALASAVDRLPTRATSAAANDSQMRRCRHA
jgi:hypothetical protein